jgi:hypothetical protein
VKRTKIQIVKDMVDLKSAYSFQGDYLPHILVNGVSGSGKSTLLVLLVLRYIEGGYTVIWREMGKYDILSRFMSVQDIIDFYKSEDYTGANREKLIEFWEKYATIYDNPLKVISSVEEIEQNKINIIAWDIIKECSSKEVLIQQYYQFFKILREQRELKWEQNDLVVILDEANHLIPTLTKNPYKKVRKQIIEQTWWLSQWRGFHVRFVMSTHSTRQINLDARLQCGLFFFKQSDRKDVKDVMSHELFHLEQDEFLEVYQRVQGMQVNEVLYIDAQRRYKILPVTWIPKKYGLDEILEFIRGFNPKPIIEPLDYTWRGAQKIAIQLFDEMNERDHKRLFFVDEREHYIKIQMKVHQFWNYLFEFKELRMLFCQYDFLDAIGKNVLCLYEEFFLPNQERERVSLLEKIVGIVDSDLTDESKVYELMKLDRKMSGRRISAYLDIGDTLANKLKARVELDITRAHIRTQKEQIDPIKVTLKKK